MSETLCQTSNLKEIKCKFCCYCYWNKWLRYMWITDDSDIKAFVHGFIFFKVLSTGIRFIIKWKSYHLLWQKWILKLEKIKQFTKYVPVAGYILGVLQNGVKGGSHSKPFTTSSSVALCLTSHLWSPFWKGMGGESRFCGIKGPCPCKQEWTWDPGKTGNPCLTSNPVDLSGALMPRRMCEDEKKEGFCS
jgi:hypothetical protein